MALADIVKSIVNLDSDSESLLTDTSLLLMAKQKMIEIIKDDYRDIYKRTITIESVSDGGDYALFYAPDHGLGAERTKNATLTGFTSITAYNVTEYRAVKISDDTFRLRTQYGSDNWLAYGGDDSGTAKSPYISQYELAEAYFLAGLIAPRQKRLEMGIGNYDARNFGQGQLREPSPTQAKDFEMYFTAHARTILRGLGYSYGLSI
jgi:hypothetical protein